MVEWQDLVFAGGAIAFSLALIPSILSDEKPAEATSFMTATILSVFTFTYASLHFYYATITTSITALLWWLLYIQKGRNGA